MPKKYNNFIEFCDCFYKEIIQPLTDNYYYEFVKRIKFIANVHQDKTIPKSKKIKLEESKFKKIINFFTMKLFNIESNEISFQNKNLIFSYNFVSDEWLCWNKNDNEKKYNNDKKANNFLPFISYLYDYYYDDYYWKVNYDIFIYLNLEYKKDFLQVMFNNYSCEIYDESLKIHRIINSSKKMRNNEKKIYFSDKLAIIISNYFRKIKGNYLFVYLCFPVNSFKDQSYHANLLILEKNLYLKKNFLNSFEPQGKRKNLLISNLHKKIVLNINNCEHKYLSIINIQNDYDKWGFCYFFCNFFMFHILYFLQDVGKKDQILPIHHWSNEIIKYYTTRFTSFEIMELIGKFAIFLGLYNKDINYAWGGIGPSQHYRTILFNFNKKLCMDIKNLLLFDK